MFQPGKRRKAPWPDFRGAEIFEGDTIIHPSGECGTVVFDADREPGLEWRVKYLDGDESLWLGNQIGDKGQAYVLAVRNAAKAEVDCCHRCRFGLEAMFGIQCRKRAPGVNKVLSHHDIREFVPVFPVMKPEDWCGEFSAKGRASD